MAQVVDARGVLVDDRTEARALAFALMLLRSHELRNGGRWPIELAVLQLQMAEVSQDPTMVRMALTPPDVRLWLRKRGSRFVPAEEPETLLSVSECVERFGRPSAQMWRRVAESLGGVRHGRSWLIPAGAARQYAESVKEAA